MLRYLIVFAACAACMVAAVAVPAAQEPEARRASVTRHRQAPDVDPARSTDWSDHNGDLANSRYAPLTGITPENAGRLELAWSLDTPGPGVRQQTPLVVDGVMYFTSGSSVYALDAATGAAVWTFETEPRFGGGGRGPGYGDGRIYAIAGPFVYAVDARTGEQVWRYPGDFGPPDGIRTGILATPMTYRVNGRQYVSVVARDRLLTFTLP